MQNKDPHAQLRDALGGADGEITLPYPNIEPIVDGSPANPQLWNLRYSQIDYNFEAIRLRIQNMNQQLAKDFVSKDSDTGAANLPAGGTDERGNPDEGKLRFNKDTKRWEGSNGSSWASLGGATGGGTDAVFYLNDQVVKSSYEIPVGQNAVTAGPITIQDGQSVTIPTGSTWSIT